MRSLLIAALFLGKCLAEDTPQLLGAEEQLLDGSDLSQVAPGQAEDPNATAVSDPNVRIGALVQGQSGRVTVFAKELGGADPNKVSIVPVSLREVNAAGKPVGFVGADKHYMLFGQWNFTASAPQEVVLGTANATQVTFSSPVGASGQVEFGVSIVSANGTVGDVTLAAGDILFNITVSQWQWCNVGATTCSAPSTTTAKPKPGPKDDKNDKNAPPSPLAGAFLDFFVAIRGRKPKVENHLDLECFTPRHKKNCNVLDLGGGVTLDMTNKLVVDGKPATMPLGFPNVADVAKGGNMGFPQSFAIRLPLFNSSASYVGVIRGSTSQSAPWRPRNESDPEQGPRGEVYDKKAATALKILGHGGKIRIFSKNSGERDRNAVDVSIMKIQEVDESGAEVGTVWNKRHGLARMDNETFTVGKPMAVNLSGTALAQNASITLSKPTMGSVRLEALVITKSGTVGPAGDQWNASAGDLKFNVALSNWHWCNEAGYTCNNGTNQVGAFIDVYLLVKGKDDRPQRNGRDPKNHSYGVGGSIQLQLTSFLNVDGNASAQMPPGFPNSMTVNNRTVFVLRFPRFSSTAVYDPLITASGSDSVTNSGPATTTVTTTTTWGPGIPTTYTSTATVTTSDWTSTTTTAGAVLVNSAKHAAGISQVGGLLATAILAVSSL